jgi:hypothetical protein
VYYTNGRARGSVQKFGVDMGDEISDGGRAMLERHYLSSPARGLSTNALTDIALGAGLFVW